MILFLSKEKKVESRRTDSRDYFSINENGKDIIIPSDRHSSKDEIENISRKLEVISRAKVWDTFNDIKAAIITPIMSESTFQRQ